jgi:hypothetical protein
MMKGGGKNIIVRKEGGIKEIVRKLGLDTKVVGFKRGEDKLVAP